MALDFSNLTSAITQAKTAIQGTKGSGLKNFLNTIDKYGIQVSNNFVVNFSAIPDLNFLIQSISIPGLEMETAEIYYDGQKVDVPVQCDFGHDFTMMVLDDAQGYIHSTLANFILTNNYNCLMGSGFTCTVKAVNGDDRWPGTMITFNGVRITQLGSITFDYSQSDIIKFDITCKCQQFTITPGTLGTASNILGAVNSLIS